MSYLAAPAGLSWGFSLVLLGSAGLALISGRKANHIFSSGLMFVAAFMMLCAAIAGMNSDVTWQAPQPIAFAWFPLTFHLDTLSSIFLALLGFVAMAISLFSPGYLSHFEGRLHAGQYWSSLFLFLFAMALVILSADAITFIVFWELMSLSSVVLVAAEHKQHRARLAALIYLGATRTATAFLSAGFLWMHSLSHSWSFADWKFATSLEYLPAIFILLGFCIKAGIWPFHIWLPYAHPAAPAPVSALMSGVMIKIALYGMVRILVLGDLNCLTIGYVALFLGTISAFWGVLFALVQHDLKRLLAYCSVENVGLILMAIAVALNARANHLPEISAIALSAAIFHCINHGLFKSLLFLGAGAVDAQSHSRDISHLGGLAKVMPWTMACFLTGSAAICALPPLNGFASKWVLYQSFLQTGWQSCSLIDRSISFAAIGVLTIVGGLGVACFTKAVGVSFLGNARSHAASNAKEATKSMIAAQVLLALACLCLGLNAPYAISKIAPVCLQSTHQVTSVASTFVMPMGIIASTGLTLSLIIYAIFLRPSIPRRYITWDCGFGNLSTRTEVSSDSFSQPIAKIFGPILQYKIAVQITGKDRRHFPEYIRVEPQMVSFLESRVYMPVLAMVALLSRAVAKLQAGSIHLYLLYVCTSLILLLIIGTQL